MAAKTRPQAQRRKARRRSTSCYTLYVELLGSDPLVWRRFTVPGDLTLEELHLVLQRVMGWEEAHLHQFETGKARYGSPALQYGMFDPVQDESAVLLCEVLRRKGMKLTYEYDFGDGWLHGLRVEDIRSEDEPTRIRCLEGAHACPPEDCGGVGGYLDLLAQLEDEDADPDEREELLEWFGAEFDPEAFDIEAVNRRLKRLA